MVKLFKKLSLDTLQHEAKYPGYIRVFNSMHSAACLILIEQLAITNRLQFLTSMLNYIIKHPFHNNQPMKLYYYRHTIVTFRSLVAKLHAGLGAHLALELFYASVVQCQEGYTLTLELFTLSLFQTAGFKITTMSYLHSYKPVTVGEGNYELTLIEEDHAVYGYLLQKGDVDFSEIAKPIKLQMCSICHLPKVELANNLFCMHQYCIHCLKIYFRQESSIKCPKSGCYAKVIYRLLKIRQDMSKSVDKKPQIKVVRPRKSSAKFDNWPPKFTGSGTPSYIEQQHMNLSEILIKNKHDKQIVSIQDVIKNENYCSNCLMTLQGGQQLNKCGKHYQCIQCIGNQEQCQLCN